MPCPASDMSPSVYIVTGPVLSSDITIFALPVTDIAVLVLVK
jgi:hypothetical protein